ncbi:RagB/SusD family nutrient uptake outer membrane protein [Pseudobacter ginsenosidimutans]|uniref:SusD-like starch-binding protein associating with outer membrane n=1 Tax=Pseudobacter ginsenosidimutans TaxID=661488 RepID=A0A4Q7N3V7_9BACT|nr:RagB/SusD family nutrient uptake outer membrane protein [Pseudobacter ginsenosidimutans]QEC44207.1 RagB/SusD family nutrient uptake outer membrane protein [Pseudobacter ginsenosidimutans]RZS75664.1 SusD-like starch-binding protein associating with outer membrane [Pseudobacter ginsenosidimutans]
MKSSYNHLVITILLLIQLAFTSCEKLIAVDMPDNQIDKNQVFENLQTANAALAGLYSGLFDNSPISGGSGGTGAILGVYTDDMDYYAASNADYQIFLNQQIETNTTINTLWLNCYQHIYKANIIIEGIVNSRSLKESDKNSIKGEALLVRSVVYFYLQQLFGDIPYTTTTNYQFNQTISRTPATELLSKLQQDLTEAIALLSDNYRSAERIIPNRKVAELMLAKVYLLQHKWIEAELLLKTIVQSPMYQFQNDITQVFKKSGKHIIWQLKPLANGAATKEVQQYYHNNAAPTGYALSENLVNAFSDDDLRKKNWMLIATFNQQTWHLPWKYQVRLDNTSEYSIVFRLEEVYLLLAEAYAQQNLPDKITEALTYVNAIKDRAGIPILNGQYSKEDLLSEIIVESRKEFFSEMGHRFLDLKRLNRLPILVTAKPNWKDYHIIWPLPQKELLLNSNLLPQNYGY